MKCDVAHFILPETRKRTHTHTMRDDDQDGRAKRVNSAPILAKCIIIFCFLYVLCTLSNQGLFLSFFFAFCSHIHHTRPGPITERISGLLLLPF